RLSMLTAAAPSMPTVAPAAEPAARETIMPAPRPLFVAEPAAAPASSALTSEEWSLVATFPSAATAMQLASARQSGQWSERSAPAAEAPLRTLLSGIAPTTAANERVAAEAGRATSAIAARGGAPAVFVAPTVAAAETQGRLPGGRTPRGSFIWPKLAESPVRAEWTASATVAAAERAQQAVPGTPLWGSLPPLIAVAPSLAAQAQVAATSAEAGGRAASPTGVPRGESLTPSLTAASLTHEMVRGDIGGAAGAGASDGMASEVAAGRAAAMRNDAPAMTLMTAAATREARAAARMGARSDDAEGDFEPGRAAAPGLPLTSASGEPMRAGGAAGVSNVRPAAAMPLMTASPTARDGAAATGAPAGPAARALELARPFLRLVESGIGSDGGQRAAGPRFFEQPQPLVAGAPSSDSASRIVEALRSQPSASSGDDRVSLADLTLIAIASATQQVAASPAGGGPSAGGAAAAAPSAAPEGGGGHGGGAKSGNPAQEIEELARAAFDELQRLMAIARERSGDHG
ncbi:MAG: hypothetical protein ACXVCV_15760, partial [Polyangia bacterium]